jgi:Domain of unknown function DUF302
MLYIVETAKDVESAARDLEEAVKRNKFGVLHVHDLQKTLKEKGVDFPNACKILEVCNPQRPPRSSVTTWESTWLCPAGSRCIGKGDKQRLA